MMNLLDSLPPELRKAIREGAERDLGDMKNTIRLMAAEVQGRDNFEDHMSFMVAVMMKYIEDPVALAMMFTESVYLLAEKSTP